VKLVAVLEIHQPLSVQGAVGLLTPPGGLLDDELCPRRTLPGIRMDRGSQKEDCQQVCSHGHINNIRGTEVVSGENNDQIFNNSQYILIIYQVVAFFY
jgi:hypothetical protein